MDFLFVVEGEYNQANGEEILINSHCISANLEKQILIISMIDIIIRKADGYVMRFQHEIAYDFIEVLNLGKYAVYACWRGLGPLFSLGKNLVEPREKTQKFGLNVFDEYSSYTK